MLFGDLAKETDEKPTVVLFDFANSRFFTSDQALRHSLSVCLYATGCCECFAFWCCSIASSFAFCCCYISSSFAFCCCCCIASSCVVKVKCVCVYSVCVCVRVFSVCAYQLTDRLTGLWISAGKEAAAEAACSTLLYSVLFYSILLYSTLLYSSSILVLFYSVHIPDQFHSIPLLFLFNSD